MQEVINKNFDNLTLDFNKLTEILSVDNYTSVISSNYLNDYILQTIFKIRNVHTNDFFTGIINKICSYKKVPIKSKIDAFLFVAFTQGTNSIIHKDAYDVFLYGLFGETLYIIEKEKYNLKEGDLLHIKKDRTHQALGITPRIVLSIGLYNDI